MPNSTFILSTAILLSTVLAAAAASDGLPRLDVQKACRSRAQALAGLSGTLEQAIDGCVRSEHRARDALAKAWKDIPASYKANCIKPGDYSPSYEEWISCLEMSIDVKALRSKKQ